jgi:uncharacterized protein YgiM (DUF1202 family)
MKKIITILVLVGFLVASAAPMAAAGGHGHHYRPYVRYHHHSYARDNFWIGLGVGVLTGAIVSSIYYDPPPPPRRVVYYAEPQTVVVHNQSPTVIVPPERQFGTALPATYGQVTVTPAALNLRAGPGIDHEVTGRVKKGDVLDVIASQPGWFYIRTPEAVYGWVMDQYTEPAKPVG